MAAKVQDIVYNQTGQSLIWDPPEGVPSSVTSVAVYSMGTGDDGTAESATTGSASIDSVNTTVDAASGAGQSNERKVNLTATTGIVATGARYVVTSAATAEWEWVRPVAIASADYVIAAEQLQNAYAAADTFKGTRLSISVDSTWVADSSNISDDTDPAPGYRVRWVYVVGGVTHTHQSYVNLVRYPFRHSVTSADMLDLEPNWVDLLPTYHREDQGKRIIDAAFDYEVRKDIILSGHAPEMIRDQPAIDTLTMLKARANLYRFGRDEAMQTYTAGEYETAMDGWIRIVTRVKESVSTSGAGTTTAAKAIFTK